MEKKTLIVKPKVGFGELLFGQTMEEAEALFGAAEEKEEMDAAGEYPSTVWHYWSHGFTLFFDHSHKKTFTCAEIDNKNTLLWDLKIFELSEEKIVTLFQGKGFFNTDAEKHEWGERRLSFDDAMIDFYFENGKLTSINFGIQVEQHPDKILILPN